jgi:Carboxypeptidase regulatory-like domain
VLESVLSTNIVTINGVTIRHGNKTGATANAVNGGGVRNAGMLTINNSIVTNNSAIGGGGIGNYGPALTLTAVTVSNNSVTSCPQPPTGPGVSCYGGGLDSFSPVPGTATITNSSFNDNINETAPGSLSVGAGAAFNGEKGLELTITGSSFNGNTGSGLHICNARPVQLPARVFNFNITNSVANQNTNLGVVFSMEALSAMTGTFARNVVDNNSKGGIGLFNGAEGPVDITIDSSTISNNTAQFFGGGIRISTYVAFSASTTTIRLINSTISGNTSPGSGGGIDIANTKTFHQLFVNINFCTIAGNHASGGGGGISGGGFNRIVRIKNSIVADNTASNQGDLASDVVSEDYNHFENITGATITGVTTHNVTGTDPQLGPLANNAGPTLTHMPLPGSPVLNTIPNGINGCGSPGADQRGYPRPVESACEKGSVERPVLTGGPWNISGRVTTADGRPIRNVEVIASGGGLPQPVKVYTGMMGQYLIANLPAGSYDVSVNSKRFTFPPGPSRVGLWGGDSPNLNFTALPGPNRAGKQIGNLLLFSSFTSERKNYELY